ncbi:universal stress protein UspA [Haladaptatus sp. NG-WS-4]
MSESPQVLIPIDTSDPEELPLELVEALCPMGIIVLRYYPVPDQTAPEQLRDTYQEEAKSAMKPVVRSFIEAGADVESVLVFTRDLVETTDRVVNEYGCDAVLVPGKIEDLDNILVSLEGEENMFRVLEVVGLLMEAGETEVTLFHVESREKGSKRSELYLRGATDWLTERGLNRERITWEDTSKGTQESHLLDLAEEHDFVVMGEDEPSIRERLLGDMPNRLQDRTGRPVLVIRKER